MHAGCKAVAVPVGRWLAVGGITVAWLALTIGIALARFLIDEDVNHWTWPDGKNGPSSAIAAWIWISSGVVAAGICGFAVWMIAARPLA